MAEDKVPENCDELKAAVAATSESEKGKQQILIRRAIELGCVENIPDEWEVNVDG